MTTINTNPSQTTTVTLCLSVLPTSKVVDRANTSAKKINVETPSHWPLHNVPIPWNAMLPYPIIATVELYAVNITNCWNILVGSSSRKRIAAWVDISSPTRTKLSAPTIDGLVKCWLGWSLFAKVNLMHDLLVHGTKEHKTPNHA